MKLIRDISAFYQLMALLLISMLPSLLQSMVFINRSQDLWLVGSMYCGTEVTLSACHCCFHLWVVLSYLSEESKFLVLDYLLRY